MTKRGAIVVAILFCAVGTSWGASAGDNVVVIDVAKVVPPGDMQKIRELVKNDAHLDDTVTSDMALGSRDGLNQTPTLVIVRNAYW